MVEPAPLCQVAFSVTDLKRTHRWYQDMLGFLPSGGTPFFRGATASSIQGLPGVRSTTWWLMDQQAFRQLEMFEYERPRARPLPRDWRPNDVGYTTVGLHVSDFEGRLAHLAAADVRPLTDPIGAPPARRVCIRDPEGVLLELMEDDPRQPGAPARPRPHVPVATRSVTLSVPDLARSHRFFVETLQLEEAAGVDLHRPEHEALWGLEGARSETLLLWADDFLVELKQYTDPVGQHRPEEYRICDQGLLNVAFGFREKEHLQQAYERVVSRGYSGNRKPFHMPGWGVVYVNDDQCFSVELLLVRPWFDRFLGFQPRS